MTKRSLGFALALLLFCSSAQAELIKIDETVLPNGLTVVTAQDRSAPVITFQMFVEASVRTERKGITGISHFSEHYYSMGSKKVKPRELSRIIQRWGGSKNAFTGLDYTSYYASVPKDKLDEVFELYADGIINKTFPENYFKSEMKVVQEERRLTDNSPYGSAWLNFQALAFNDMNYQSPILGYWEDLKKITLGDVKEYYSRYYSPGNIVVVVAGDVSHPVVLKSAKKWFGKLEGVDPKVQKKRPAPARKEEARLIKEREGQKTPIIYIGYDGVEFDDRDFFPLRILASVLSDGPSSRFQSSLVKEKKLAETIYAYVLHTKERGLFVIYAEPMKGKAPSVLERAVYTELQDIINYGISDSELQKTLTKIEKSFITGLESTRSKAGLIGEAYMLSDENFKFYENYLDNLKEITCEDVQKAAAKYFKPEKRAVYIQIPKGSSYYATTLKDVTIREHRHAKEIIYPSGLRMFYDYSDEVPALSLNVLVTGGSSKDPKGKSGLSDITASLLNKGSSRLSEQQVDSMLDKNAIDFASGSSEESIWLAMNFLKDKAEIALDLLSDFLIDMKVEKPVLQREKEKAASSIESAKSNPHSVVRRALSRVLFSGTGYEQLPEGSLRGISSIDSKDVMSYYDKYFRAPNTILSIVGDIDLELLIDLVGQKLGDYRSEGKRVELSDRGPRTKGVRYYVIDMPWLSQTYILAGGQGLGRANENFSRARVANYILGGGGFTSRLTSRLRTEKGLAYSTASYFDYYKNMGTFIFFIQTKTSRTKEALDSFFKELDGFAQNGARQGEFKDAISYYKGSLPFRLETMGSRADSISSGVFYGHGPDMVFEDVEEISGLSLQEINAQAEMFKDMGFAVILAGKKDEIKAQMPDGVKLREISIKDIY